MYIKIWFGLYHKSILETLDKTHKERSIFCCSDGRIYIDNRNTRMVHLYEDILHLLL